MQPLDWVLIQQPANPRSPYLPGVYLAGIEPSAVYEGYVFLNSTPLSWIVRQDADEMREHLTVLYDRMLDAVSRGVSSDLRGFSITLDDDEDDYDIIYYKLVDGALVYSHKSGENVPDDDEAKD